MAKKRPNNYWTRERVNETLKNVSSELGHFPSQTELKEHDLGGLLAVVQKKFGGLDDLRIELGFSDREEKPSGYWADFNNVRPVLIQLTEKLGHFPKFDDLRDAGYSTVAAALSKYHGGANAVKTRLGIENEKKSWGYWKSWENVEAELAKVEERLGRFPNLTEILEINAPLRHAIVRHHGGLNPVREKYGVEGGKKSNDHWKSWDNVKGELEKVIEETGSFPTQTELAKRKLSSVAAAMQQHHGGFRAVRVRMGYNPGESKEKGYWDKWKNLETELKEVIEEIGHFPSQQELNGREQSYLVAAMNKHGGLNAVKRKMNYELSRRENGTLENFDNLKNEIDYIIKNNTELKGKLPSSVWLKDHGHSDLLHAINRYHGGFRKLRELVGAEQVQREKGAWKDFDYTVREALSFMHEHGYDTLPGTWTISKKGYGSLSTAITKYHGGITSFRERLNQQIGRPADNEQLASLLERYVGGQDEK